MSENQRSLVRDAADPQPRRLRPLYRVFVSSTWLDLQPERKALMEALHRMEEMRFVGMEFFGNRPDDTHDVSVDQVDLCELFVGIIGHRYGSGITEAEYRRARELGLPCFVYFKAASTLRPELTDNDPALAVRLATLKQELMRGHTVKEFTSPEELAASATADLHNWVAARWISMERAAAPPSPPRPGPNDTEHTNVLRLLDRVEQDWVKGVLEASLHHRAWLDLGLDWRTDAVEHPWDRIVVAADRPIQTLSKEDSITGVFQVAQNTLLVLGEPGAGKTTTVLELARDLIARARDSAAEPAPVVLALTTWRGQQKHFADWLIAELGLRYQVPKRVARGWLEEGRLVLILDGLDEVTAGRRADCVTAINAFVESHPPAGLAVTCRVAEYNALATKLRLRSAICLQPLTERQVDRYFEAAGPALEPLRRALRADSGLGELARSPLMLSVMTMALRSASQESLAPLAAAQSPEELRRQLFESYLRSALDRRGKASAGYTAEQTIGWLGWLARRMKENGHALFTLEQLQPAWLGEGWRQFGYFMLSRLLGGLSLVVPFFVTANLKTSGAALALLALATFVSSYLAVVDFAIARHNWGGSYRGMTRLWCLAGGLLLTAGAWLSLLPSSMAAIGAGGMYLIIFALAFCAPVDVRGLDIKPTGSIQWSRKQAYLRWVQGMGVISALATVGMLLSTAGVIRSRGWAAGWSYFGGSYYVAGLVLGGLVVWQGWKRLRVPRTPGNVALATAVVLLLAELGGSLGALASPADGFWGWHALPLQTFPALLFAAFGGFGATMIDPARPQKTGFVFWLRVPLMALATVGLLIFAPGLFVVGGFLLGGNAREAWSALGQIGLFSLACGLIAFLRFGGFNGVQHYLLRWLLARSGHLPARPEQFLTYASQIAVMQKVGLGYRFIHALLLQHLAQNVNGSDASARRDVEPEREPTRGAGRGLQTWVGRAAAFGLVAGFLLALWIGVTGVTFGWLGVPAGGSNLLQSALGTLLVCVVVAIPVLLLTGRRLASVPWRSLAVGWAVLAAVGVWLWWDHPNLRYPGGLPESANRSAGPAESHAVLLRYSRTGYRELAPAAKNFRWPALRFSQAPEQGAIWRDYIMANRAAIQANWESLATVRSWMDELNAFARLADLTRELAAPTSIAYSVRQSYVQNATAIAGILAVEGQGDAALAVLLPLIEVGGKLEEAARTRGYYNDARAMQAAAIRTATFVLDTAPVTPAGQTRLAAALAARGGGSAGARRPFAIYYQFLEQTGSALGDVLATLHAGILESLRPLLDVTSPLLYNRHAMLNHWGEMLADLQDCAVQREPERANRRVEQFYAWQSRPRVKSIGEAWAVWAARDVLGLGKVAEQIKVYWRVEDQRAALLARLRASHPGSP